MPATTRRTTKLTERPVIVLRRYAIKVGYKDLRPGDVVLVVRNDRGVEYTVTLRQTKQHSCTCPSRKPCYHIVRMAAAENARWEAERVAKAAKSKVAEEAKAIKVAKHAAKVSAAVVDLTKARKAKHVAKTSKSTEDAMMAAPLTTNKGFSLYR